MTTRFLRPLLVKQSALLCLAAAVPLAPVVAGPTGGGYAAGMAEREMARRMQRVADARIAIDEGDKLMAEKDCEGALAKYSEAIQLLPIAAMTEAIRDEVNAKYCKAAVCLAEERAKNGRYAEAKALLNDALARHPDCEEAEELLEELDDPERYEPALTSRHVKNVAAVEKHLQMGYSYYNLGDFDAANRSFQEALRVDPYNKAARRGMERVEQQRSLYFDAARDHTRSKMIAEVDCMWEDPVPAKLELGSGPGIATTLNASAYYTQKMQEIIFPAVQFQGASIEEAVEFLRIKSRDYDTKETDPSKKGVNLIIKPGTAPSTQTISLG